MATTIQTLLSAGAKNLHGYDRLSILHDASHFNHHEVIKVILNNVLGRQLLHDASNKFNDSFDNSMIN